MIRIRAAKRDKKSQKHHFDSGCGHIQQWTIHLWSCCIWGTEEYNCNVWKNPYLPPSDRMVRTQIIINSDQFITWTNSILISRNMHEPQSMTIWPSDIITRKFFFEDSMIEIAMNWVTLCRLSKNSTYRTEVRRTQCASNYCKDMSTTRKIETAQNQANQVM